MREFSVPPLVNVPPETNITDLVLRQAAKASNPALFSRLDAAGQWQDISATDFLADVSALAKGLMASGVARRRPGGHHVPHALRVGAGRLRHLVRRRRVGSHLRDVFPLPGRLEPGRLGRRGRLRRVRPPRGHHQAGGHLRGAHRPDPRLAARRRRPGRRPGRRTRTSATTTSRHAGAPPGSTTSPPSSTPRAPRAGPRAAN